MKTGLTIAVLLNFAATFAQPWEQVWTWTSVSADGVTFDYPFLGGINTPRFQFADLNLDGFDDLILLDNQNEVIYLKTNGSIKRYINSAGFLSSRISSWFLLKDLNEDSRPDLISKGNEGQTVWWKHTGNPDEPFGEPESLPAADQAPIVTDGLSQPCLSDFDRDGDQDFFAGMPEGTILFYENTGTVSVPEFSFRSTSFGGIYVLQDTVIVSPGQNHLKAVNPQHGASAVQFFDLNRDGLEDIFFGDFLSNGIYLFMNRGPAGNPEFEYLNAPFPESDPIETPGYNQVVFRTSGGQTELFVGVNLPTVSSNSFWYYRNDGPAENPEFILETRNYLSTPDLGRNSKPVLYRFSNSAFPPVLAGSQDGFLSLFLPDDTGNYSLNSNRWGFSQPVYEISPAISDLDHNGKAELAIGSLSDGLSFYSNTGTLQNPVLVPEPGWKLDPDAGNRLTPFFFDLDGDADEDLVVGTGSGTIRIYETQLTGRTPTFTLRQLLEAGQVPVSPSVYFNSGRQEVCLAAGSDDGTLSSWKAKRQSGRFPEFQLDSEQETGIPGLAPGGFIPVSDDSLLMIAGCRRGGLILLKSRLPEPDRPAIKTKNFAFPNPSTGQFTVFATAEIRKIDLFSVTGQLVFSQAGNQTGFQDLSLPGLSSGVYFIRVTHPDESSVSKLVILK
ncbi:MAG: T9SS type A sorting domain-containing protein [Bacteroidetes bacterium]|nr:T9SS type A sorting domain-containing protein [Bacteroidota bacterium]